MAATQERKHSTLSPSSAHRWLVCTPSALLEKQFPDTAGDAAAEGSLAHDLAELKVRNYFCPVNFGKRKLTAAINKLKKHELWQNEMMGYTDEYLDYVKSAALKFKCNPTVKIEEQVPLDAYVPHLAGEDPASGFADCILIGDGMIHVIDFKYGKGVPVSAEGNPQLALYALGAYELCRLWYHVDTIRMSIVQPRLPDGVSEWECPLKELLAFGRYVKERGDLAITGGGQFTPGADACRFCRAGSRCRARADENVKLAPAVGKLPPLISNDEMGEYLRKGSDLVKWLSVLKDIALKECLAGREVSGWKAVEGRGSRDWTDLDAAFTALSQKGIDQTILWEKKPLSPAQVEKVLGKPAYTDLTDGYVTKSPGKPALAEASDKRPAITNKVTAAEAFKENNHEKQERF